MAYQTIKEGIAKMLKAKGFLESKDPFTFEEGSDQSTHKRFRIERPLVDCEADGVEFLSMLVRPVFGYRVTLGFKLADQTAIVDYDVAQILIDNIVAYLNNKTNYETICIKIKTRTVETRLVDEHLEAEINLEVIDDITLA